MAQKTDMFGRKVKGPMDIKEWINYNERTKGCTKLNVHYLREFKQVDKEMGRIATVCFFLVVRLQVYDVRQMMISMGKQRDLIMVLCNDLKVYRVEPEDVKMFDRNLMQLKRRCDHVFRIIQENIRLTEYEPYFRNVGYERLVSFDTVYKDDTSTPLDDMIADIEAYNSMHEQEVAEHMESVKAEIEARDAHRQRVKEQDKLEKELRKAARKAERDEAKEIKKNNEKHAAQVRKDNRIYEYYCKDDRYHK